MKFLPRRSRLSLAIAVLGLLAPGRCVAQVQRDREFQLRTGLPWQVEHFVSYFLATSIICLAWPRPFVGALVLTAFAGLLESLQGLTPDRVPDLPTALSGAAGVLSAALLAKLLAKSRKLALARPRQI